MIIFFYGSDGYRSSEKTKEYVSAFALKNKGLTGFAKFDFSEKNDIEELIRFFETTSIFSVKKLAIVDNLLNIAKNERLEKFLKNSDLVSSENDFLLVREIGEPDIKNPLSDFLKKNSKQSIFFSPFKNYFESEKWLKSEAEKNGGLDEKALRAIFENFSQDEWRMANEIKKAAVYFQNKNFSEKDLVDLFVAESDSNIFEIFEKFFHRDRRTALEKFKFAMASGIDEGLIFNLFIDQMRTAVYLESGREKDLAANPFKVRKIKNCLSFFKKGELKKWYDFLAEEDWLIKTGRSDYAASLEKILGTENLSLEDLEND